MLSVGDYTFQRKGVEKIHSIIKGGATVIFVSHNLRAMAGLCQRSILMEKGKVVEAGPTNQVIKNYLARSAEGHNGSGPKEAFISKVNVQGKKDEVRFEPGDKVRVEVEVTGNADLERLAVLLEVQDESFFPVFEASSEHITDRAFTLSPGRTFKLEFELTLHLAPGTYHLGVWLYRHDTQKTYDTRFPSATFYVSSDRELRGVANLYPVVIAMDPC